MTAEFLPEQANRWMRRTVSVLRNLLGIRNEEITTSDGLKPLVIYEHDMYGGVRVNSKAQNYDIRQFAQRLKNSLELWLETKVGGVWMNISLEHSHLIPICASEGFDFHHAQPGYVMMTRWLPKDRASILPPYANQYLGCAGMVINSKNQVLVVKERYTSSSARWKLPGGAAEIGEDIAEAAIRETLEETGIRCEFVSLLCFRHMHGYRYGCSDLYAICLLKPLTEEITKDETEIHDCCWMDVDDWLDGDITGINRFSGELYREIARGRTSVLQATKVPAWNMKKMNTVYSAPRENMNSVR